MNDRTPPGRPRRRRGWLLLAGILMVVSCAPVRGPRPNILLITLDTTRVDHCSIYGYPERTTPNLGFLASSGVRFDLAYAPTATTGPTHASIFTGLYSLTHGVVKNGLPLDESFTTLAELLADDGYETGAILGSYVLDESFGYDQGFSFFDDDFAMEESAGPVESWEGRPIEGAFDRRAAHTTRRALRWLEERPGEEPFFLFVHYFDPHDPYLPPEEYVQHLGLHEREFDSELDRARAYYDAEISYTDNEVGRLLQAMAASGVLDETLVVVTGDHGEGLMDHGYMYHGVHIYEEAVRVPLIVRWPEVIPPAVISVPVELVDLAPTVLELAGVEDDAPEFHGRSLAPVLRGEGPQDPYRVVYLHRRDYREEMAGPNPPRGQKYGVRAGQWKYIEGPEEETVELFDLAEDPDELNNLEGTQDETSALLSQMIQDWRARCETSAEAREIPADVREKLEALGYTN